MQACMQLTLYLYASRLLTTWAQDVQNKEKNLIKNFNITYMNTQEKEQLESELQAKKDKIISVQLVGTKARTSNSYGRNMPYMRYKAFVTQLDENKEKYQRDISDVFTARELKALGYWSNRSLSMSMTCWGTSQYFEAQLALGKFIFPKQKKGEEWGDYTRRITSLVYEL